MKRLLPLLLLTFSLKAATVSATITYAFPSGSVACSTSITTNCLVNFEVGTLNGTTFTPVPSAVAPLPPTLTGTVTLPAISFLFNGQYGNIQFAAVVIVKDWQGNNLPSAPFAPSTAVASVLPVSPTGLAVSATNP